MAANAENAADNSSLVGASDVEQKKLFKLSSADLPKKDDQEVLSPEPIFYFVPEGSQVIPGSSLERLIKRMRWGKSVIEETQEVSFGLFEHQNGGENYILEMNEIQTGERNLFQVFLRTEEEKLDVRVKKLSFQLKNDVVPIEVDNSSIEARYNIPFQDRLKGWTVQKRKRNNAQIYDKYYIHEKVQCTFRSLNEVAVFIVYSSRREDIVRKKTKNDFENATETRHNNEDIPSTQGTEGESQVKEDDPIFSFAINNPIIKNL